MKMMECWIMDKSSEKRQKEIIREMRKFPYLHAVDASGGNLLSFAAAYGLNRIAEFLIAKGVQINQQDKRGCTALSIALQNNNPETAAILLKHGANPSLRDQWGKNALMCAGHMMPTSIFRQLIEAGCDPNEENNYGINAYKLFEAYPEILQVMHDTENGVQSTDAEAASKRAAFPRRISAWIREKVLHR